MKLGDWEITSILPAQLRLSQDFAALALVQGL
jgi:hypothetical protein